MKIILPIVLCVFLLAVVLVFGGMAGERATAPECVTFEAVVTEITEEGMLVMPDPGSAERGVAMDRGLLILYRKDMPKIKVGDHIRISYSGMITRSIPGQLGDVFRIDIID